MSEAVVFEQNQATIAEIAIHLQRCDAAFVQPLSQRIPIDEYAKKLVQLSVCFEARVSEALVGLVAAYCNDPSQRIVFISNVSVLDEWQHQGIASALLRQCRLYAVAHGFDSIELEVAKNNVTAISLYAKLGFLSEADDHNPVRMSLPISQRVSKTHKTTWPLK